MTSADRNALVVRNRKLRAGLPMPVLSEGQIKKFWSRVNCGGSPDACWIWQGAKTGRGYGNLTINYIARSAHRVSYGIMNGNPIGGVIAHRCDNPPCVNPNHLFLTDHAGNAQDREAKGRGDRNRSKSRAKLSWDDVYKARELRRAGMKMKDIGVQLGVCLGTISCLLLGKTWKGSNPTLKVQPPYEKDQG